MKPKSDNPATSAEGPAEDEFLQAQRRRLMEEIDADAAAGRRWRRRLAWAAGALFLLLWVAFGLPPLAMSGAPASERVLGFLAAVTVPLSVMLPPAVVVLLVVVAFRAVVTPGRRRDELQLAMLAGIDRRVDELRTDVDALLKRSAGGRGTV